MQQGSEGKKVSGWQVFYDDTTTIFLIGAAILFASYTVWGLMELASAGISPLVK